MYYFYFCPFNYNKFTEWSFSLVSVDLDTKLLMCLISYNDAVLSLVKYVWESHNFWLLTIALYSFISYLLAFQFVQNKVSKSGVVYFLQSSRNFLSLLALGLNILWSVIILNLRLKIFINIECQTNCKAGRADKALCNHWYFYLLILFLYC